MSYSLDPLSDCCYENSTVLINKFDIRDEKQLDTLEQGISSALIAKAQIETPFEDVNFEFYKKLHSYVFSDIYEWAGQCRKVDMSKKGTSFCSHDKIEENGIRIFNALKKHNYLMDLKSDDFINEFTDLYCELNYLHPFREGNGRIQRLFLSMLAVNAGRKIDFSKIDKDLFIIATIKAISGDVFMLRDIFYNNLK